MVPSYIEKYIITHPAVEDAGVVGLPDEMEGELPMAFIVLRKGKSASAEELIAYTNGINDVLIEFVHFKFNVQIIRTERVAEEEKLRGGVRFIDRIPRNDLGKIVRPKLTQLLLEVNK